MSFQFNNLAKQLFSFMMLQLQRQWKQGTVLITMLLHHVLHNATIVSVYNMLRKALSLNTIESTGKQCSECAIHNLVTIVEVNH